MISFLLAVPDWPLSLNWITQYQATEMNSSNIQHQNSLEKATQQLVSNWCDECLNFSNFYYSDACLCFPLGFALLYTECKGIGIWEGTRCLTLTSSLIGDQRH